MHHHVIHCAHRRRKRSLSPPLLLSELFLDTDNDSERLGLLATALDRLDLPLSTLEHILRYDLFPNLIPNLLVVAGEWMYFDEDDMMAMITRGRTSPPGPLRRLAQSAVWFVCGFMVIKPWEEIKAKMQHKLSE